MATKHKKIAHKRAKKRICKGSELTWNECGLTLAVVEDCDCVDTSGIVCCGEPMIVG